MTSKEKAVELIYLYNKSRWIEYGLAKKCALIAVNEIIDAIVIINEYDFESLNNYWQDVKQEIEKL
jgi:hypothetical protein